MKKKNLAFIILVICFLLIVSGVTYFVYDNLHEKKVENEKIENSILKDYEVFREKVDDFTLNRATYHDEVLMNLFIETVESDYDKWIPILEEYTSSVDAVENASNNLKDLCVNHYYSKEDIKNKCQSFVIAYETTMNYYTKDILSFNDILEQYRTTAINSNENLNDYELKYNYTDINKDGNFVGKD